MAKRILIAGSTGYIGSQITKKVAGLNPAWHVLAMSRKDPQTSASTNRDLARYKNVQFIQADCLDVDSYPDLSEVDAIVHSVGAITDMVNYKQFLRNPQTILQNPLQLILDIWGSQSK